MFVHRRIFLVFERVGNGSTFRKNAPKSSEILGIVPPEPPLEALQGAKEKIPRLAAIIETANVVRSWFWPIWGAVKWRGAAGAGMSSARRADP
jgi:hypothetical protein